jgi:hypothetical protein
VGSSSLVGGGSNGGFGVLSNGSNGNINLTNLVCISDLGSKRLDSRLSLDDEEELFKYSIDD